MSRYLHSTYLYRVHANEKVAVFGVHVSATMPSNTKIRAKVSCREVFHERSSVSRCHDGWRRYRQVRLICVALGGSE